MRFLHAKSFHCPVYGNTFLTTLLYKTQEQLGIKITHIVEDIKPGVKRDVSRLPESTSVYPETDAIIICDIINVKKIRQKLQARTNAPIHLAEEVFGMKI
jgi:hypothetical protein